MTLSEHVRFCLTAPVATIACVGADHELHANEAFAALIGAPAVPVSPAREILGDQWAVLAPLVERAPGVTHGVRLSFDGRERVATVITVRDGDAVVCTVVEDAQPRAHDDALAMLAHELRSPLAPVMTTLEVMRRRGSSEDLTVLERPLRQLARQLDDVLEYSRIATGMLELHRERVELARVVDRALELAGSLDDRVSVAVPRAGLTLVADIDRLATAVSRLIADAVELGGGRVALTASGSGERVRLTVRAEGALSGDADRAPTIGAAITRSLVRLHGGTISVAADGLTVELPVEAQAVVRPPEHVRERSRKRILIVEDNDDTARSLKTALELLGYEVAVAHDGPVALTVARTFHPDAALLDIGLPVMDGYELAKRLRSVAAAGELPVVAVTAYGADSYRQRSVDAGFAEHLVKPADLAQLERVLDTLLG